MNEQSMEELVGRIRRLEDEAVMQRLIMSYGPEGLK